MKNFLQIKGLSKVYGATVALDEVNMNVKQGSVHAIIGENGAGKSTLIKILSGLVSPEKGSIILSDQSFSPNNLMESCSLGVSTAFQELSLLANLTVAQNLALPYLNTSKFKLIPQKRNIEISKKILKEYGLNHISPTREVATLSLAEKQKLEIVKAISKKPKLLLLDEPTSALPDPEWLFEILERIKKDNITILYISHRLNEIRRICDAATILRSGKTIESFSLENVTNDDVFKMMIGESGTAQFNELLPVKDLENLRERIIVSDLNGQKIKGVSLSLREGEILGVAGLEGQGQDELFKILTGVKQAKSGDVIISGRKVKITSPQKALKYGIGFVSEERKTEGILPGLSTMTNITLSKINNISRLGFIGKKKEEYICKNEAKNVQLEERYLQMPIDSLSGGNQQKVIMSRVLLTRAPNLFLYDPSRGVDVGTKHIFYEVIKNFAQDNGSVLWYSTDLSELVHLCDRIIVFYDGEIVMECLRQDANVEDLITAATGHHKTEVS